MSSKIEVSRELLERVTGSTANKSYDIEDAMLAGAQIRALLAAPVVERPPQCECSAGMAVVPWLHASPCPVRRSLHKSTAPPELAELQATIARLEDQLNKAVNLDFERRAEIERLKSESFEGLYNAAIDERDALAERLTGGHGEPVRWMRETSDGDEYCEKPFTTDWTPLFASQPAPVSAINENAAFEEWRKEQIASLVRMGYPDAAKAFRDLGSVQWAGWQARACLDKVKELNQ